MKCLVFLGRNRPHTTKSYLSEPVNYMRISTKKVNNSIKRMPFLCRLTKREQCLLALLTKEILTGDDRGRRIDPHIRVKAFSL